MKSMYLSYTPQLREKRGWKGEKKEPHTSLFVIMRILW